jgi:hypothetical protein
MHRIRNLDGVTKYVVWTLVGLGLGALYALVTGPFFSSGPPYAVPALGAWLGFMQAFYSGRRKKRPKPPVTRYTK